MAYFANSSEASEYMEKCTQCVHYNDCPIVELHLMWNYEQWKDETKRTALSTLFPNDSEFNNECRMFYEKQATQHCDKCGATLATVDNVTLYCDNASCEKFMLSRRM